MATSFGNIGSLFSYNYAKKSKDSAVTGTKPILPELASTYQKTIADNTALAPDAMRLADITNRYNLDTRLNLYKSMMPDFEKTLGNVGRNLEARTRGEVAPDVLSGLARRGAAWNLSSGTGSGGIGANRLARDFGLTSMGISREAQGDTAGWLEALTRNVLPEQVDIRDYSISPTDAYNRDREAAFIRAGPDPSERFSYDAHMTGLGMLMGFFGGGAGGYQGIGGGYGGGGTGGGTSTMASDAPNGGWWSRSNNRPSYSPAAYQTGSWNGSPEEGPFY